jgi:hypothetical protein
MDTRGKVKRVGGAAVITVLVGVLAITILVAGCGSSLSSKQKEYKDQYVKIMDAFQSRVTADDQKANQLVAANDIGGLITLVKQRIANIDQVEGELMQLYPPPEFRKIQAITLYYMAALRDRLDAQNALNEAALSGKPTTDLKAISDGYGAKTQFVGQELAVELEKQGIKLKGSTPSSSPTPQQSSPSSATSGSAPSK